jgi:hypothetical protein
VTDPPLVPPARNVTPLDPPPPAPDPDTTSEEPLLGVGTIVTGITGLLDLAVLFGVHLSNAQEAAILAVVTLLAPILVALIGRKRVWSPVSVNKLLAAQRR